MVRGAVPLALALAPTMWACGESAQLSAGQPSLTLEPAPGALSWGRVEGGASPAPQTVAIGNAGAVDLTLSDVRVTGRDRFLFRLTGAPAALAPGQKAKLQIDFAPPSSRVDVEAALQIESNDPSRPSVRYPLTAIVESRCRLIPEPSEVATSLDTPIRIAVRATNDMACTIVRVGVDTDYFQLSPAPAGDIHLAPGEAWTTELTQRRLSVPANSRSIRFVASQGPGTQTRIRPDEGAVNCVTLSPSSVIFPGPLFLGDSAQRTLEVVNDCDLDVELYTVSAGSQVYTVDALPPEVPAYGRVALRVEFTPHLPGDHPSQLAMQTSDQGRPMLFASLMGTAEEERIDIQPAAITFAPAPHQNPNADGISACGSPVRSASILNATAETVTVQDLAVVGDQRFAIIGATLDAAPVSPYGLSIGPQQQATVDLRFYPSHAVPFAHTATLAVSIDGFGTEAIHLTGLAVADGLREERFAQSSARQTDVVLVVDQSGSMREERARLERNLGAFLEQAARTDADLRIGLTTADGRGNDAGRMYYCLPHPPYVDGTYADPDTRAEALGCALSTLPPGSVVESGLGAAVAAVHRGAQPLNGEATDPNRGFLRRDAHLAVVIVSDEDDQSPGTDAEIVAALRSVKNRAPGVDVRLHAIIGDPNAPGCVDALPAPRYARIASQLGGQVRSICLDDWHPVLESVGRAVVATQSRFPLELRAAPATIEVQVGGQSVMPDPQDGFTYDRGRNSVQLNGAAQPSPGTEVVIRYAPECDP